jgi:hypothetical protein
LLYMCNIFNLRSNQSDKQLTVESMSFLQKTTYANRLVWLISQGWPDAK